MKLALICLLFATPLGAQQHEVGLLLGRLNANSRDLLRLGSGTAYQANYGYRVAGGSRTALLGEVHFLANPQRIVGSGTPTATRDVATIFLTPGLKLKFFSQSRVSPYVFGGAGWAVFEQSLTVLNGAPNPAPRTISRAAATYGGGADFAVIRQFAFRGEFRGYTSGSPAYNLPALRGAQQHTVLSIGMVFRFGGN